MRVDKRQKRLKRKLVPEMFEAFERALNEYQPDILEIQPETPEELYRYYACIDKMYIWLKNAYKDDLCVLCNEMRAILGHLSEYGLKNENSKDNLQKAYGHFRRLSIDTLKILCNGLDKFFDEWINQHACYDYSNIDNKYFPDYVTLYNEAHKDYINVQRLESLGSDKGNKIIKKYHTVAQQYGKLYAHHTNIRRIKIERTTIGFKIRKRIGVICAFLIVVMSVLGAVL